LHSASVLQGDLFAMSSQNSYRSRRQKSEVTHKLHNYFWKHNPYVQRLTFQHC